MERLTIMAAGIGSLLVSQLHKEMISHEEIYRYHKLAGESDSVAYCL